MRQFTEEHRKKIGEARKKWFAEHPKEKEKLRKAVKKWWKEHRKEMITSGIEVSQLTKENFKNNGEKRIHTIIVIYKEKEKQRKKKRAISSLFYYRP